MCKNDCDMFFRGGETNNEVARNQNGLVLPPEVSQRLDQWLRQSSKAAPSPPWGSRNWLMQAEVKATGSSKAFPRWPFIQPVAVPASAVVLFWWHLIEKVILSLYKNSMDCL